MSAAFAPTSDAVVELRQYTHLPGRRDELITLFEREFLDPQNAAGARVIGHFRDLDDPARFVWLRGFDSMAARRAALTAFYEGPVWQAQRDAANATLRDSDNVMLLRPVAVTDRRPRDAATSCGVYVVLVYDVARVDVARFANHFADAGRPALSALGADDPALFVSEVATNTFARLPVREGESAFVCIARFADAGRATDALAQWHRENVVRTRAPDALLPAFMRRPEVLRLVPAERSSMR